MPEIASPPAGVAGINGEGSPDAAAALLTAFSLSAKILAFSDDLRETLALLDPLASALLPALVSCSLAAPASAAESSVGCGAEDTPGIGLAKAVMPVAAA